MAIKTLGVTGVLYTDRRRFYPDPQQFAQLYPGATPFISSLFTQEANQVPDADFKMFEHRQSWLDQYVDVNDATPDAWSPDGSPGGTVTVTVDNPTGVSIDSSFLGHVVEIWSENDASYKGHALVTAVPSSTSITLKAIGKRDDANEVVSSLADNDRFHVVGTAFGEGTEAPDASSDELDIVWNSCQEFKTSVEITKPLAQAALRGESSELRRLRMEKGNEHKIKIEKGFLTGYRIGGIGGTAHGAGGAEDNSFINHITDADGNTVRTTMGLITALERYGRTSGEYQNIFTIDPSAHTYNDWVETSQKVFQYNPLGGVRTAYCGWKALNYWSKLGGTGLANQSSWTVNLSDMRPSRLGFNYRILETPNGLINLVPTPILRGRYAGHMVIADLDNLEVARYERPEYNTNIKTDNDPRLIKDEYFNNDGLKIRMIERHHLVKVI